MSYRYRASPTATQVEGLALHCQHARYVWNLACEQQSYYAVAGRVSRPPNSASRFRQLAEARAEFDWLAAGSSSVQQQALRDWDQALRNWLTHRSHRRPSWRKAGRDEGCCVRDVHVRRLTRRWAAVFVPKVGWLRFRLSRPLPVTTGMARITCDRAGRWHVSFTAAQPAVARESTGSAVGIDRGVAVTLATSDGQHHHLPHSGKADRKARTLAARMSRQRRGSHRRTATKQALATLTARAADRRKDWVEKTSTRLVRAHDVIVFEDLRVTNMVRKPAAKPDPDNAAAFLPNRARAKAGLNRSIHRSCWGLLARRVEDKASASGVTVVTVNPAHSSTECRVCGHTQPGNRESQTVFRCLACGHQAHADTHAAQVILARGLAAPRPPQDMGQDPPPGGSARGKPEPSVARTTRSQAAA